MTRNLLWQLLYWGPFEWVQEVTIVNLLEVLFYICFIATYMIFQNAALIGPIMIVVGVILFTILYACYFMFYVWGF